MRPETVLVGDVTVVVVPKEDQSQAVEDALRIAGPGSMVVVTASSLEEAVRDLARYGGVVVRDEGHVVRPRVVPDVESD
jgi:hypothetical protein